MSALGSRPENPSGRVSYFQAGVLYRRNPSNGVGGGPSHTEGHSSSEKNANCSTYKKIKSSKLRKSGFNRVEHGVNSGFIQIVTKAHGLVHSQDYQQN